MRFKPETNLTWRGAVAEHVEFLPAIGIAGARECEGDDVLVPVQEAAYGDDAARGAKVEPDDEACELNAEELRPHDTASRKNIPINGEIFSQVFRGKLVVPIPSVDDILVVGGNEPGSWEILRMRLGSVGNGKFRKTKQRAYRRQVCSYGFGAARHARWARCLLGMVFCAIREALASIRTIEFLAKCPSRH
jgi:hypothetical protein